MIKKIQAQSSLELAVAFVTVMAFFVGMVRIWSWSNTQMVARVPAYNSSRVAAGSTHPGAWPVYTPSKLTDEWVFGGNKGSGLVGATNTPTGPEEEFNSTSRMNGTPGAIDGSNLIDLSGSSLDSCGHINEALGRINDALSQARGEQPEISKWRDYWDARLSEASAGAANSGSNVQGYATATLRVNCGDWESPNYQTCSAKTSPCLSGCTLSCNTCPVYDEWGNFMYYDQHPSITVSGGYSNRTQMAKEYYEYYLATSGFTSGERWMMWSHIRKYKWHDNPHGSNNYNLASFRYHPGRLDWQARVNIAQGYDNSFRQAYDSSNLSILELENQKDRLEQAFISLGCE